MSFDREKYSRSEPVKPTLVYEDVMYGQRVTVKRYPSNIPVIEMPYADDMFRTEDESPK
jgi:hypothetical protein